jgi:glycosyltransferase involved in cell wall biosynthesis
VAALIKGADVGLSLVLPVDVTHRLASPTKLFEYMMAGLPVIGSDVPEIREVVARWNCGLLVDAAKPHEIAAAIIRLAAETAQRKAFADGSCAAAPTLSWTSEKNVLIEFVARRLAERVSRK